MSDLIERQAAIDAVKWGESVRSIRDEIERLPSANARTWMPDSVKPKNEHMYLVLVKESIFSASAWFYKLLCYGQYTDWLHNETKFGWHDPDGFGFGDYDVLYWTELPDVPEVEE